MPRKLYRKICPVCDLQFEHIDHRQKHCSRNCYNLRLKGEGNPFFGKKHSEETKKLLQEKCGHKGKENPFYGKTHSSKTKSILSKKAQEYALNNKDRILDKLLLTKGIQVSDLSLQWICYKNGNLPLSEISKLLDIDRRSIRDNWLRLNICTLDEYIKATEYQKIGKNSSFCEEILYNELVKYYNESDIIKQFCYKGYYFDFLLLNKYVIEYDGYYYHKILQNNDLKKTKLIENSPYTLIRIQEPESRKTDFDKAIRYINEICSN